MAADVSNLRDREQGETIAAMRHQHPAVESAINKLEHRGFDYFPAKGSEGFARTVTLSVVALNVHRIGRLLCQQVGERHRLAARGRRKTNSLFRPANCGD